MSLFTTELRLSLADENMVAYQLYLSYDPALLEIRDIEEGADGFYTTGAGGHPPGEALLSGYRTYLPCSFLFRRMLMI